jgi:hypothetical protein
MTGATYGFGPGLLLAAAALLWACGGGSGDTTGPPPGGADQVDSLVLQLDSVDVPVDDTMRLRVEARNAHGEVVQGVQLTFTSSDRAVATVSDDGLVTAIDLGKAEIEVGLAGSESLGVSGWGPALSQTMSGGPIRPKMIVLVTPKVVIKPGEQTIDQGASSKYSVTVTKGDGKALTPSALTWSSSKSKVATVDKATGLATALAEGATRITATVSVGGYTDLKTSVTLHVNAVCGGIFNVVSWSAAVGADYIVNATVGQTTIRVSQISTGGGDLVKDSPQSNADSVVWKGPVHGTIELNNSLSFPVDQGKTGVTTEAKSGPIEAGPSALARLTVKKPAAGSNECTYDFQYGDFFTWQVTNNQGAPPIPMAGPIGTALNYGVPVGARPATGWFLGGLGTSFKIPGTTLRSPSGGFRSAYAPGTGIGIYLLTTQAMSPDPRFGEATFGYILTAR